MRTETQLNRQPTMHPPISTAKPILKLFAIEDLLAAPFNPPMRTEPRALTLLKNAILALGFLAYPPLVSKEGRILDGHRRIAVLRSLSVREVWCIVLPTGLAETFVAVNSSFRPFDGRAWFWATVEGLSSSLVPGTQGQRIRRLENIADPELRAILQDNNIGSGVIRVVGEVARGLGLESDEDHTMVLRWLVEHNAQRRANEALRTDGAPVLLEAIIANRPIVRRNGIWQLGGTSHAQE